MDIHRLRDHFDTPTTLPQLHQAILQLAVQGQLVPQDHNDEPTVELSIEQLVGRESVAPNVWQCLMASCAREFELRFIYQIRVENPTPAEELNRNIADCSPGQH